MGKCSHCRKLANTHPIPRPRNHHMGGLPRISFPTTTLPARVCTAARSAQMGLDASLWRPGVLGATWSSPHSPFVCPWWQRVASVSPGLTAWRTMQAEFQCLSLARCPRAGRDLTTCIVTLPVLLSSVFSALPGEVLPSLTYDWLYAPSLGKKSDILPDLYA